ncbi:MAG: hypothetical protein M1499_08355 [Firmicutes bacterium]|nr:hypothetical protein [Bacillota bacterium]
MRPIRGSWRARRQLPYRLGGVGLALVGGVLVIKVLPIWAWAVGIGLWLVWAGLGPLLVGGLLIWVGYRLFLAR